MNHRLNIQTGTLTIDGFAIHPGLTQSSFKKENHFERRGDAQQYEWYTLHERLVNRGIVFTVNLVFEGERLHWTEIHRDIEGNYDASVLTELKNDLLGSMEDNFTWGNLSVPGNQIEDKFLLVMYS